MRVMTKEEFDAICEAEEAAGWQPPADATIDIESSMLDDAEAAELMDEAIETD